MLKCTGEKIHTRKKKGVRDSENPNYVGKVALEKTCCGEE